MRRLLVLFALGFAALASAGDPVVCSAPPKSPGVTCSAAVVSAAGGLWCECGDGPNPAGSGSSTPSTLLTGLVHYWTLDESSTGAAPVTRNDSIGTAHLTDNNTVGSVAGLNGLAASFVAANSEWLSSAYVPPSGAGVRYTVAGWVKLSSITGYHAIWGAGDGNGSGYILRMLDRQFGHLTYTNTNGNHWTETQTPQIAVVGEWAFVCLTYDGPALTQSISVNDGTPVTAPVFADNLVTGGTTFSIGRMGVFGGQYADSAVARLGIWTRVLTATERTCLYNSGAGNFYPYTGVCTP